MAKIYIDPGHNASGADTGAVGYGLKEQDITVQIGVILRDMLVRSGQTVKMSRESVNDTISSSLNGSLSARCNGANNWGADLFVSIHCNAANTKAYGCETYYCTGSTQGKALADEIQPHLAAETGLYNRGVKSANFAVLRHTNMPAVLVETAFIDNYDDNKFLASESGRRACATAMYKGICDYLGINYNLESEDNLMSREYEELNGKIAAISDENNRQNEIINEIGKDIQYLSVVVNRTIGIYDHIDDNMPDWAKPTIQKLTDKGYLKGGSDGKLGLTEDVMRILVINDRAGVYGE